MPKRIREQTKKAGLPIRGETDGTEPVTDNSSKNVMIAAERRDKIHVEEIVEKYEREEVIPEKLSVIRRVSRYYGPELILYADINGDRNYLLNAPGPGAFLHLWRADIDEHDRKKSYTVVAEVKASLRESSYERCSQCGELLKSVEHERYAAMGKCPNV